MQIISVAIPPQDPVNIPYAPHKHEGRIDNNLICLGFLNQKAKEKRTEPKVGKTLKTFCHVEIPEILKVIIKKTTNTLFFSHLKYAKHLIATRILNNAPV